MESDSNVRVAIRIRPQVSSEILQKCSVCTSVTPNEPQIWLGSDKAFTFDHVFDILTAQNAVYENCVHDLVEGCFEGYNATVLAYGQTGSGKTYTMGTGFDMLGDQGQRGIIPRAIQHLFNGIDERQKLAIENNRPPPEFKVSVQFLELYNEEIIDLLNDDRISKAQSIKIHEDPSGGIYTVGATAKLAPSADIIFQCLKKGALSRQTGSTNMNVQSSRSHAIFTIILKQQRMTCYTDPQDSDIISEEEFETLCAKFHFVDLAGSERLKRTGATGDRAKEGISINSGLLALGNVISALGDRTKRAQHVPYRDSKLTRLLQDSLGGNSRTLMIACISPSDRDFMETLSTLRYANRAKNIRNKVLANQDKSSQIISLLRKQIADLEVELQEYRQGKRIVNTDGTEQINDMYHENRLLNSELSNLKTRLKALQDTHDRILAKNAELLAQKEMGDWSNGSEESKDMGELIKKYFQEIEELRSKLIETEEVCSQLRKQLHKQNRHSISMSPFMTRTITTLSKCFDLPCEEPEEDILSKAREEVNELKRKLQKCATEDGSHENGDVDGPTEDCDEEDSEEGVDEDLNHSGAETDEDHCEPNPEIELANLANEISLKERLISEIENSQKKIDQIKHSYEDKLKAYEEKLGLIEAERDQVLAKLSTEMDKASSIETANKIRDKYEKQLAKCRDEIRKFQDLHRQHTEKTKNKYESELRSLRSGLEDLKRQKVRLLNQMKEENMKHREKDRMKTKTILQLTKQERVKDVKIRNLEKETNRYKSLLKRKDDEVLHLKKKIRPFTEKVAGRVVNSKLRSNGHRLANTTITKLQGSILPFSPKVAKNKWQRLQQTISKIILDKQKIASQEHQMERYLVQREELSQQLDNAHAKLQRAVRTNASNETIRELQDEIDNFDANIKYLNQNLNECQSLIVSIEEQKEELENLDLQPYLSSETEEIRYLFEKLLHFAIHNGMVAHQKEEERREYELKCKQIANSSQIQEEFIHQMMESNLNQAELPNDLMREIRKEDDDEPMISVPTVTREMGSPNENLNPNRTMDLANPTFAINNNSTTTIVDETNHLAEAQEHIARFEQLSRKPDPYSTADILRNSNANNVNALQYSPKSRLRRLTRTPTELNQDMLMDEKMTQSLCGQPESICKEPESLTTIARVPSAPSLKDAPAKIKMEISPSVKRRHGGFIYQQPNPITRQTSSDFSESTPPASPPANRRNIREEDVFSRLTSNMNHPATPNSGVISRYNGKTVKSSYLTCSHHAIGHNRPVLSVTATDRLMLSGSKDNTAKVWDLTTGKELQSLRDHSDSVVCVRFDESSNLAFTVSRCVIKVWDIRQSPIRCVKTMGSNGISELGNLGRQGEASNDPNILDVQLSNSGSILFSTCSQIVRIWDLRMFHAVGKLNSNHQSKITCLAVEDTHDGCINVVTGSKDHYVKVFNYTENTNGCFLPRSSLEPPHFDGLSSLALHQGLLYSASRDGCIKLWDVNTEKEMNSKSKAHKDNVLTLHIAAKFAGHSVAGSQSPLMVSGCKGGRIKLWDVPTFSPVAELQAHSAAIHSVYSNSTSIITASSDCKISLWRRRTSTDPSPDYQDDFMNVY